MAQYTEYYSVWQVFEFSSVKKTIQRVKSLKLLTSFTLTFEGDFASMLRPWIFNGNYMNSRLAAYVKTKFMAIAQDLMENPSGLKFKLEKATEKINKTNVKEALGVYFDDLFALIRLSKAWVSRKYTKVSKQTILYTILAVVYFVTPTDFVPDFLLGLGFMDDIAVLSWVLNKIKADVAEFKRWETGGKGHSNEEDHSSEEKSVS